MTLDTPVRQSQPTDDDDGFPGLLAQVRGQFASLAGTERPLFRTDLPEPFAVFLENLPGAVRQQYTCSCCRRFVDQVGSLVAVSERGELSSAVWPDPATVPARFARSVEALRERVVGADIVSVFLTPASVIGTPQTGPWSHLAVDVPAERRHRSLVSTAGQTAAAKREERGMLERGLDDFPVAVVAKALEYLTSEGFYRSERAEAVIHWLLGLHEMRTVVRDERARASLLWVAAASAPAGFCHVRSGMVGTLFEDIVAGLPLDDIRSRWATKMSPTTYMRAQVAPSAGNVAQAEKIISALKAAGSLDRRYARLEDIPLLFWRAPAADAVATAPAAPGGVFGHLATRVKAAVKPTHTITWEAFQHTILPEALRIEAQVPDSPDRFMALITAAQPDAPPILQWDSEQARNPFSWYYAAGIDAEIRRRVLAAGGTHEGCDIRVSLLWNNRNDLDLHVMTPAGEHIYFGAKRASCGGFLDVDMNVRGETDKPVENVRWVRGGARAGLHRVFVRNFAFHHDPSRGPTPFRLELEVSGEVFHLNAVISHAHETGEASDVQAAEFVYVPGQKLAGAPRGLQAAKQDPNAWGVTAGQWAPVRAIVPSPNLWGDRPHTHHGRHMFFLLDGCRDRASGAARGFFTETLRSEFHPIRSTLEAHAASAALPGADEATACGLGMSDQSPWNLLLRVTTSTGTSTYLVDRWQ